MGDARIRDITRALPPAFAGQLFTAREQGANEQQLQQITANGLAQMYFRATTAARTGRAWSSPTPHGSTSRGRSWPRAQTPRSRHCSRRQRGVTRGAEAGLRQRCICRDR
ncbi:hypothetical protein ABZY36_36320 [Streptomyces sp. NPDC006627]|uniref:hypothetical protein n=1 Tax=Streptomyces sp. NPDC006627 TaxID=3154679 RepID=UPI0033A4D97F